MTPFVPPPVSLSPLSFLARVATSFCVASALVQVRRHVLALAVVLAPIADVGRDDGGQPGWLHDQPVLWHGALQGVLLRAARAERADAQ
eukprot:6207922-Pleurochrysis_carterae.AAC.1